MKFKQILILIISIAAAALAFCRSEFTALAVDGGMSGVYTAKRTQSEIREYLAAHPFSVSQGAEYSSMPDLSSPYENAGALGSSSINDALNALNCARFIAGLDEVEVSETLNAQAQQGAYIMRLNKAISHYPAKPSGVSDDIYSAGAAACAKSNVAADYRSLADSVFGYLEDSDSYNIKMLGHRRWCLNPKMGRTGFGEVEKYQTMWAFDTSNSNADYAGVAWPARNMPVEYFGNDYAWSWSLGQIITNTAGVEVTLTRASDKKTWRFSEDSSDGSFAVNNEYYGEPGCVIFRPDSVSYKAGDSFTVSITGAGLPVSYGVEFFSAGSSASGSVPNVSSGKPTAVKGLKATSTSNTVTLSWGKNASADSYQVDMYQNDKWVRLGKTVSNSFIAKGLEPGRTYEFKVFAFNREEYSSSARATATTKTAAKVAAVTELNAAAGSDSVELTWNKNPYADKYQVDMYENGKWVRLGQTTDGKFTAEGLSPRTGYEFKVFAFEGEVYSPSARISITTLGGKANTGTAKPAPVTNLKAEASGMNSIRLSWSKSEGADKYQVDIYKNGSWRYLTRTKNSVYTARGLETGTGYKFRVYAFNGSAYSSSVKTSAVTNGRSESEFYKDAPSAVTNLTSASGSNSIRLSWHRGAGADRFRIDVYRYGKWFELTQTSKNSYTVRNLSPNTTYRFRVTAVGDGGSSPSEEITAKTS